MLKNLKPGDNPPVDINVVIEIPAYSEPVKYEFDKSSDMLIVDRFLSTSMQYPCNYGFVPNTLTENGNPLNILVPTPISLIHGAVIKCRPIGKLKMVDESGVDVKIIAVPVDKLTRIYSHIKDIYDLPELLLNQIKHFFEHYKTLELDKWVIKINEWENTKAAKDEIIDCISRYK